MRFLAGISVFVIASGFTFKRLKPKSVTQRLKLPMTRRIVRELQLWKNKVFVIWVAAITLVMFGYYIPYVHLVTHAEDIGIPPDTGSILVMVLGGSTATGRLLFGKILEVGYMNRLSMHQLSMVVTGTFCMLLPLIRSFYGLLAYVIVVGLVDGCYVVLLPVLTAQWVGDDHRVMAWGFVVGVSSITYTLGPPVAGWIADATGSYDLAFHVAGIPIVFGSVILFLVPWAQKTARATNFLSAAKDSFAVPLGAGNTSDGINEEHKDIDDNDSILSGPLIEVRKCDEDAVTLTTMDSSCLIVNLKKGTIAGRAGGRHEDTDTISEITKLHDIAQAIEILSRASASILDMERTSIMSSFAGSRALSPSFDNQSVTRLGSQYNHDLDRLPMSSTSCSRQNAAVQTPNNGNLSNMDLESFFAHAHLDHSGGKLLSPYGSPLTFLTSPGGMPQQRESSNLSLPAVKEEERALHSAAVPTLRRTRYSSVPVDFMDSHGCDIDLIPHHPDNKAQPTDAENSGPVHSPETWPDTESNLVTSSVVAADDLSTDSSSVCSAVNPSSITASVSSGPASSIESSNNRVSEPPQMITPETVFHHADEGSVPIANSGETHMSDFTSQDDVSSSQITVTMSTAKDKTDQ